MKKNTSRLIVFCAVIMGFMLVGYDSSFADAQNLNLEAAHFVPAAGMPINDDVTPKEQASSTWQSAFEWVLLPTVALGSLLLLVWGLANSAASMLPALPQVETVTTRKQAARYGKGNKVKPWHRGHMKFPVLTNNFPYHVLTLRHPQHLLK